MSAHGRKAGKRGGQKEAPPPKQDDVVQYLPSVEGAGTGRTYWNVVRTGRYDWDNFLGAGLADQLLKMMKSKGNYTTFNFVIRDMIAGGTFGGVEIGFLSEIAKEIIKRDIMAKRLTA
jgi:hypothetical protein